MACNQSIRATRSFVRLGTLGLAQVVMALWTAVVLAQGSLGDVADRESGRFVFAGSHEVVGSGLKTSRRTAAQETVKQETVKQETATRETPLRLARASSRQPSPIVAKRSVDAGLRKLHRPAPMRLVKDVWDEPWDEAWDDPYENTPHAANEDAYLDLDLYQRLQTRIKQVPLSGSSTPIEKLWDERFPAEHSDWQFIWMPDGLVYSPPMADPKASRLGIHVFHERDDGWLYDATLGATVGILRFGSPHPRSPDGFQLDVEGSAQLRLDIPEELDVRSADFRVGVPFSYGVGRWRSRVGYYHLSSHLGDEFLLKNPGFARLNYVRDVLYVNQSMYPTDNWRLYVDVGWAFYSDVANEWEFQFGTEYVTQKAWFGAFPFLAINGKVREELDYGGALNAQFGWMWKAENGRRLRLGFHYFNGHSKQWSFFQQHEEQLGIGLWVDR